MPGERERTQEAALAALAKGDSHFRKSSTGPPQDGEVRWMVLRAEILMTPRSSHERVVGVLMDIDEQKQNSGAPAHPDAGTEPPGEEHAERRPSIAAQTFKPDVDPRTALQSFHARLRALADANDILVRSDWTAFDLTTLIDTVTAPYRAEGMTRSTSSMPTSSSPRASTCRTHSRCTNWPPCRQIRGAGAFRGRISISCERGEEIGSIVWQKPTSCRVRARGNAGFG